MVNSNFILSMEISALVCFLFPIVLLLYLKKKENMKLLPFFTGMIVFFVFTQILEKLLHLAVIGGNLIPNPILFSIYGALAAGVFEETGRFVAFKTVLKNNHEWKDGLSYGIGHGGIESILIGAVANIQYLVYCSLINNGTFDTVLTSKVPASQAAQLDQLKELLINSSSGTIILGMAERIFAFGIQIALTMVVLYGIRYRKNIYLFIAILLHALIDFPAALYQTGIITNVYVVEAIVCLDFVIAVIFLFKTKNIFSRVVVSENSFSE